MVGPDGLPQFGTSTGRFLKVDFSQLQGAYRHSALTQFLRTKRWVYQFIATPELAMLWAIVDVGYSSNAFATVVHLESGRVLADLSQLGLPRPAVHVSDETGVQTAAHFRMPGVSLAAYQNSGQAYFNSSLKTRDLEGEARLLTAEAAPFLAVVAPVEGHGVNVTHKHAALKSFGWVDVQGQRFSLDGGVGGLDFTNGILARETSWRWGFACGRLPDGTPVGFNLVEGFNESRDDVNENAAWVGNQLFPLGRARFEWNKSDVLERWHVRTTDGSLEMEFTPIAVHREFRDLKLVKSHFQQPIGRWNGVLTLDGKTISLSQVAGVTEDQQVRW